MKVTHNIQSLNAIRLVNINIESYAESTGKISSGYKINSAADYPAGLGISEIMRRQIRGLMQATNNTKDGVAFVQSADGAMNEIHSMLQRMNELTDKSLNGTWSDSDRMAMNVEFDQLRTEIDRINKNTDFGTGIPVFEQHEPSYYQISGNRQWDDNQLHTISSISNALNIHLPDNYEPKDYTITVPPGVYTTQELIDEIDDALSSMVPPNPGFVFELTGDGYCNLRFEKADGTPTKIDSVDGSLSYLLYDFKSGSGSNDILGTTLFLDDEKLIIVNGKNDELGLYLEGVPGVTEITLRIPAGAYTRKEMIDTINDMIKDSPLKDCGIFATEYGDHCIQISSGSDASVVGLHGNMFKYEESSPVYTSIFYDNVKYGTCSKWPAVITGKTNELPIHFSTDDNILRFKINGETNYIEVKLDHRDYATVDALANELKNKLTGKGVEVKVIDNCISLSTTKDGELSSLEFDVSKPEYKNTYNTLFFGTSELPEEEPFFVASKIGVPDLSGGVVLNAGDSIKLLITEGTTTKDYVFKFSKNGTYTLDDLVDELNSQLAANKLKNKIEFSSTGSQLAIYGTPDSNVKEITLVDLLSDTEEKLLIGEIIELNGSFTAQSGKKETIQGTTTINITSSTVKSSPCKDPNSITIDKNSKTITFQISRSGSQISSRTITIEPDGTYNLLELAQKINEQLGENSTDQYLQRISAEMYGDCLQFIFKPTEIMADGSWKIDIPFDKRTDADNNSIWKNFFENESTKGVYGNPLKPASLTTMVIPMDKAIEINDKNNNSKLKLSIGGGAPVELSINGTYSSLYNLASAIESAMKGTVLEGKVKVEATGGRLKFTSNHGSLEASGNFYDNVMCRGMYGSRNSIIKGICNYDPAFIIGRQDLTQKNIEIISGSNDEFTFDFNYDKLSDPIPITVTIPEGVYAGKTLADELKKRINSEFKNMKLDDFEVDVKIGGHDEIELPNTDNSTVLQITLNRAPGKEPADGQYFIDGIRGSAANTIFYKSTTTPTMTYIAGTKNILEGISFEPGKNVLTLSVDSIPYQYTFDKSYYTAEEFVTALNKKFEEGDDNGNPAPLRASIDKNGALKISHTIAGAHTITDIGGSGKSAIFFEEEGRDSRDPLVIQVGAEAKQTMEIPRISVSSTALNVNSITISKQKYAEKANIRIKEAINLLSSKRSTYGAIQNRLEHTINNNDIVVDRMQASESRIRDTDLSSEMIRYSNLNILLQAGQQMLAQSNENIKKLLNLLQ